MQEYRALSVTLAVLGGCHRQPPASRFPSGGDALDRMKATFACANGIRGAGKIDHFGERGRIRGEATAYAVNPARIRIDIVSPFGATPYTLTSDGKQFSLNDLPNKKFFFGPASACNLARLTQVPIPGQALVYLLRGEAPLLKHERKSATITWEKGRYRVELPGKNARQTVLLEVYDDDYPLSWQKQRVRVVELTTTQQQTIIYHAAWSNFRRTVTAPPREDPDGVDPPVLPSGGACAIEVPHSIHMVVPYTSDDVLFQYREASLNPPLLEGTFTQPQPAGSDPEYVECREGE